MGKSIKLGALRDALSQISREMVEGDRNGIATNTEILKKAKAERADEIAAVTPQLIDIALTKLLNEANGRRRQSGMSGERDMFGFYTGIPATISVGKEVRKSVSKTSIRELTAWLDARDAKAVEEKNKGIKRLLSDCRQYMTSEDDTLEVALARKREAEQ